MFQTRQQRFLEEQASRDFDYGREFRLKVSVDYRAYVFLSPKQGTVYLTSFVGFVKTCQGFEAFRPVYKGNHIIHLYLRFQSAETAKMTIEALKTTWGAYLHVTTVSEMLEAMYTIESSNRALPLWTATIVDTVGAVRTTNPLARQVIASMLHRFGDPRIYDLQVEGGRVTSVQALFSSLAEALGAAIAFGAWEDDRHPYQNFHYRVRIVGGEKELAVFCQLKIPNVRNVFDMEYFVGGESIPCRVPPPPPQVNEMAAELLMEKRNEYQQVNERIPTNATTNYPMNPPVERGTHYRQRGGGGRRSFQPRRQFNNRNAPRQIQPQVRQQQETKAQQVPGS